MALSGRALKSAVYPGSRSPILACDFRMIFGGGVSTESRSLSSEKPDFLQAVPVVLGKPAPKPRLAQQTTKRPARQGNGGRRLQAEISPMISVALRTFASKNQVCADISSVAAAA